MNKLTQEEVLKMSENYVNLPYPLSRYWACKDGFIYTFRYGKFISLKTKPRKDGYHQATLTSDDGRVLSRYIHRLILISFLGESDKQCNHIDGNKSNNKLSNLEYCTRSENQLHRYNVLGKRTKRERPVIRSDGKKYPSISSVSKDGFISTGVFKVCAGQMKTHKGYEWEFIDAKGERK